MDSTNEAPIRFTDQALVAAGGGRGPLDSVEAARQAEAGHAG